MQAFRFFMLLSLVVWIGGIIFFAFVVAPAVFGILPTYDLAGKVVNGGLGALHWMGLISGIVVLRKKWIGSYAAACCTSYS
jgi:uncharacterized membrane protein